MAQKKPVNTSLKESRAKLMEIKLAIKAHQEKNTNAHKPLKKQIAQLLTKRDTVSL